jgi:hypothetical protein
MPGGDGIAETPETVSVVGARGRTRTGTTFLSRDFKSLASTNFATRATKEKMEARVTTI